MTPSYQPIGDMRLKEAKVRHSQALPRNQIPQFPLKRAIFRNIFPHFIILCSFQVNLKSKNIPCNIVQTKYILIPRQAEQYILCLILIAHEFI